MIDPSELSKIYPNPHKVQSNVNRHNDPLSILSAVSIAAWIFMPLDILVLLMNYFRNNIDWFNVLNTLPIIILSLTLSVSFSFVIVFKIVGKLQNTGINHWYFLIVYMLWMLPVSQLLFNLMMKNIGMVEPIPFSVGLFFINLVVVGLVLFILNNQKLKDLAKIIFLVVSAAICGIVTYLNTII